MINDADSVFFSDYCHFIKRIQQYYVVFQLLNSRNPYGRAKNGTKSKAFSLAT